MSTPRTTGTSAHQQLSASSPASLTERRKAETRMEIARAAAALFVRQGLRTTRAEDIAQAAGIAPRTFYRYFASKEEAVAPLYAAGAERWTQAVREAPPALTVPEALRHAVGRTLTPGVGVSASSWEWVRTLIRLADASPALRKVWAEVCQASESTLAEILAERLASTGEGATGRGAASVTPAAAVTPAAPAVQEALAAGEVPAVPEAPAARGDAVAPEAPAAPGDAVAPEVPRLRFAAAVAGAAVRVAVENWATTTAPPTGPAGPASLALQNLDALGDFGWGEGA
ncbi:TetR/AcrR family transcriptional regulator [Streptomyces sp. NPDC020800]|uniref:TetR/AcrR family transcriptional regulator n=1 Tax=Streptomyces sp. NPDC020800 TaxID=3365092 RepID=UPI0037913EB3